MAALAALAACGTRGIGLPGAGPAGTSERKFNAPVARVRMAALSALSRLKIRHVGTEKVKEGEVLKGVADERRIEVTLEPLGPAATRVKVVARGGGLFNSTENEILDQTERLLGRG